MDCDGHPLLLEVRLLRVVERERTLRLVGGNSSRGLRMRRHIEIVEYVSVAKGAGLEMLLLLSSLELIDRLID